MARIPENIIDEVQRATDIVSLIQAFIPLKRAGVNFKAGCPFHTEKTASFVVSPAKQIYHCFGCGVGGNVFHFLMALEKVSFIDAVKECAQKAGISLPESTQAPSSSFHKTYYELYQFASDFYTKALNRHPPALDYLKSRGLEPKTIQAFKLGLAPASWEVLMVEAKKKGYSQQQLERAGLIVQGRSGWRDRFVNRILYPICDVKGRVIAFGGRAMQDSGPKYLNSPETEIFKKRSTLYGLNWTKNELLREKRALVLEGYMDFLALYQAGFKYAVATLGTALTQEHVRALTRFAEEIIISYDGDKAGEDASLRGIDLFVHTGCQVRVLVLPKGFDPDEYILQKGIASFQNLIDQAPYFLDYKLDKLCEQFDPTTPYGQRDIARGMMQLLGKMEDEVLQSAWIKKCAHKLKINEDLLRRQIEGGVKTEPFRETRRTETPAREPDRLSIENELFRYLFEMPELAKEACALLSPEDFKDPILKQNFATICGLYSEGNWNGVHSLLAGIEDSNQVSFLSALSARPIETNKIDQTFKRTCARLRRRKLERELRTLSEKLAQLERTQQDVNSLLQEILDKRKLLEKLSVN